MATNKTSTIPGFEGLDASLVEEVLREEGRTDLLKGVGGGKSQTGKAKPAKKGQASAYQLADDGEDEEQDVLQREIFGDVDDNADDYRRSGSDRDDDQNADEDADFVDDDDGDGHDDAESEDDGADSEDDDGDDDGGAGAGDDGAEFDENDFDLAKFDTPAGKDKQKPAPVPGYIPYAAVKAEREQHRQDMGALRTELNELKRMIASGQRQQFHADRGDEEFDQEYGPGFSQEGRYGDEEYVSPRVRYLRGVQQRAVEAVQQEFRRRYDENNTDMKLAYDAVYAEIITNDKAQYNAQVQRVTAYNADFERRTRDPNFTQINAMALEMLGKLPADYAEKVANAAKTYDIDTLGKYMDKVTEYFYKKKGVKPPGAKGKGNEADQKRMAAAMKHPRGLSMRGGGAGTPKGLIDPDSISDEDWAKMPASEKKKLMGG